MLLFMLQWITVLIQIFQRSVDILPLKTSFCVRQDIHAMCGTLSFDQNKGDFTHHFDINRYALE